VDRSAEQRRRAGLGRRLLEMDAGRLEDLGAGVRQDVDQVRDRCSRIAADVGDAGLQQTLGDGEDGLAVEGLAGAQLELADLASEGPLGALALAVVGPAGAIHAVSSIPVSHPRHRCR